MGKPRTMGWENARRSDRFNRVETTGGQRASMNVNARYMATDMANPLAPVPRRWTCTIVMHETGQAYTGQGPTQKAAWEAAAALVALATGEGADADRAAAEPPTHDLVTPLVAATVCRDMA